MIDFVHPHSQPSVVQRLVTVASVVVLSVGSMLLYQDGMDMWRAYRFNTADASAEFNSLDHVAALPSGDYLVAELVEQSTPTIVTAPTTVTTVDESESVVQQPVESPTDPVLIPPSESVSPPVIEQPAVSQTETAAPAEPTPLPVTMPPATPVVVPSVAPITPSVEKIPQGNWLVVPQMGVNDVIFEGSSDRTLSKGLWRMPVGSNDPASGNMIVTAHRYLHRPPATNTFFLIDKLKKGDTFYMYWNGTRYDYIVREIKIVEPTEVSILHNTPNAQLTLFSCTPLFTSLKRHVVIADLVS